MCVIVPPAPWIIDAAYADDHVQPDAPQASVDVKRPVDKHTDCGDHGTVLIYTRASDDRAPVERLGYEIASINGDTPAGLLVPFDGAVQANLLFFEFDGDDGDFAFDLGIRTVDLNGNRSEPALLHVEDHVDTGCSAAEQSSAWLMLPVLGLLLRRRSRC